METIVKDRTAAEFEAQARAKNLTFWPAYLCATCGYRCGFVFTHGILGAPSTVGFDEGCYCTGGAENISERSWQDVADRYNAYGQPRAVWDKFWGF